MATFGGMIKGLGNMLQDMQPGISNAIKTLDAERQYKLDKQRQADLSGYYASMSEHLSGQREMQEKTFNAGQEQSRRAMIIQLASARGMDKDGVKKLREDFRRLKATTGEETLGMAAFEQAKELDEKGDYDEMQKAIKNSIETGVIGGRAEPFRKDIEKQLGENKKMTDLDINYKQKMINKMGQPDFEPIKMAIEMGKIPVYATGADGKPVFDIDGFPKVIGFEYTPEAKELIKQYVPKAKQGAKKEDSLMNDMQVEGMRQNPMFNRGTGERAGLPDIRQFEQERQEQELFKILQQFGLFPNKSKQGFVIPEPSERETVRRMLMR